MSALWVLLWSALRGLLVGLAALLLLFEEWGWKPLTAWAARLARWPPIGRLEQRIRRLSPRASGALFLLPGLLLFPVKVLALWLMHAGHAGLGLCVLLLAKLLGTAIVGRLFYVTEPQLMQLAWFVRALLWWRRIKARLNAALQRLPGWQAVLRWKRVAGGWWRRHKRRWRA